MFSRILRFYLFGFSLLAVPNVGSPGNVLQERVTLESFLAQRERSQIPSNEFCIDPEHVTSNDPKSLASFGRFELMVGKISAIVPTNMVVVDDSPKTVPNLYQGLSMGQKVIYLLTLLNEDQLAAIKGSGLPGTGLSGEAAQVFDSIVPRPFRYDKFQVDGQGVQTLRESQTLSEESRRNVRLQVFKSLQLYAKELGTEKLLILSPEPTARPGEELFERDPLTDIDENRSFGVTIRREIPNRAKPSAVSYNSELWNATVALPSRSTVGDVLTLISQASDKRFSADLRVADLPVRWTGNTARTGDVLESLALGVTGTYRQVGPYIHLTSDAMGLGSRRLKVSLWEEAVRTEANARIQKCCEAIGLAKFESFDYPPELGQEPTTNMKRAMDRSETNSEWQFFPDSDLSSELRAYLDQRQKERPSQPIERNEYAAKALLRFRFILPTGQPLKPERIPLGPQAMFQAPQENMGVTPHLPIELRREKVNAPIYFTARSPEEVQAKILSIAPLGFSEYWVRSEDEATVRAAVASALNVPVRLVVAPLEAPLNGSPIDDPDVNLIGEITESINRRISSLSSKVRNDAPFDLHAPQIAYSPSDRSIPNRLNQLQTIASTPGVKGVVFIDLQPPGYQVSRSNVKVGNVVPSDIEQRLLGYSTAMRAAFLSRFGMDPVDIVPPGLSVMADMRQPFFADTRLAGVPNFSRSNKADPKVDAVSRKWEEFRSSASSQLVELISQVFRSKDALVELPGETLDLPPMPRFIGQWSIKEPIRKVTWGEQLRNGLTDQIKLLTFNSPSPTSAEIASLNDSIQRREKLGFDVSSLDSDGISKLMTAILRVNRVGKEKELKR